MNKKGIDVSVHQGEIDFQKVKDDGIDFVIIREGYGIKSTNQIDKRFKENYKNAKQVNLPIGIYHFSYADSINQAKKEALFCLENIKDMQLEYPICFDIEYKEMLKLSTRTRTDICKAFCETIEDFGYYSMIYCNLNWLKNYLYKDELTGRYDLWLAHWNAPEPAFPCGIWQKSETGYIDGITGNVDLNEAYKDYPTIIKNKGLNGFKTIQNVNKNYFEYKVQKGDTLWFLAKKYLGNGIKYKKIKQLNNLSYDTIYAGQTLKIPTK